jgi:hypothetical protein
MLLSSPDGRVDAIMTTAIAVFLLWSSPVSSEPVTIADLVGMPTLDDTAFLYVVPLYVVPADTVVSVDRGDVLRIDNFSGELLVRSWDCSEVNVAFDGRRDGGVEISRRAGVVEVRPSLRKGRERNATYVVSVPSWLAVEVRAGELDVRAEGLGAPLEVMTRDGDISIRNHSGDVEIRTLDGEIDVRDSRGRFELRSLDDDVRVSGFEGDLYIKANDGDVEMAGIDAGVVEAGSLNGDIDFSGVLRTGGEYRLTTHDGDVSFEVRADAAATFSVATYNGEFETEVPVQLQSFEQGREFEFELGGGGARVSLQAFNGAIRLLEER